MYPELLSPGTELRLSAQDSMANRSLKLEMQSAARCVKAGTRRAPQPSGFSTAWKRLDHGQLSLDLCKPSDFLLNGKDLSMHEGELVQNKRGGNGKGVIRAKGTGMEKALWRGEGTARTRGHTGWDRAHLSPLTHPKPLLSCPYTPNTLSPPTPAPDNLPHQHPRPRDPHPQPPPPLPLRSLPPAPSRSQSPPSLPPRPFHAQPVPSYPKHRPPTAPSRPLPCAPAPGSRRPPPPRALPPLPSSPCRSRGPAAGAMLGKDYMLAIILVNCDGQPGIKGVGTGPGRAEGDGRGPPHHPPEPRRGVRGCGEPLGPARLLQELLGAALAGSAPLSSSCCAPRCPEEGHGQGTER